MPKGKVVTHADLAPSCPSTGLGSKTGAFLTVLTILCGLFCFILCLIAEATRSQVTWLQSSSDEGNGGKYECVYSSSGKTPLLCAASAFLGLAIVMLVEHMYMLIAISNSPPSIFLLTWEPRHSASAKTLKWQAAFFFLTAWVFFAVGEILLLVGLSVESGHLKKWSRPRPSCLVIREGVFSAAGVFALTTVFLAAGLYLTALRAQRISLEQENVRQEVLEASARYVASPPPRSPTITTIPRENPIFRETQSEQPSPVVLPPAFSKSSNL